MVPKILYGEFKMTNQPTNLRANRAIFDAAHFEIAVVASPPPQRGENVAHPSEIDM